jgi:hypothetical protein
MAITPKRTDGGFELFLPKKCPNGLVKIKCLAVKL